MAMLIRILLIFVLIFEVVTCHPTFQRDRIRRQTENLDDKKASNPVKDLQNMLNTASQIIRDLISLKQMIASDVLPLMQRAGDTVENLHKTGLLDTVAESARTTADNANNVVTTILKTGETAIPIVNEVSNTVNEISSPIIKIAMCSLVCPLQASDEKRRCEKENCAGREQ